MKVAVAGDSAGQGLSRILAEYLSDRYEVSEISHTDAGPDPFYANLADRVGSAVMSGSYDRAVLVCGTGIGVCIAANKVPGIRAALVSDAYSAAKAATSNNAQIVTIGARTIAPELAKTIIDAYLDNSFDPEGRSAGNVNAIDAVDAKYSGA
ncbi:MAG: RpiB/LacA/LacB family sugar-phosphate isomerase [Marinibacterium sp.]|nr:RpiB/LacA/LacB family sugar-phosphate isomerase [Marinibacterium sp.]